MKPKAVGLVGVEHSQLLGGHGRFPALAGRGFQAALKIRVSDPKDPKIKMEMLEDVSVSL